MELPDVLFAHAVFGALQLGEKLDGAVGAPWAAYVTRRLLSDPLPSRGIVALRLSQLYS